MINPPPARRGVRRSGRGSGLRCGWRWTTGCCGGGDSREAVAVELVGGLGDGGGTGCHRLGVDGAAVRDVEVDEAAGGRVLGRQGGGDHEDGAGDFGFGVADAAPGHGHSDACVKWGWCRPPLILPMRVMSALMCRGVDQRYETVGDSLHVFWVGFADWGQVALGRIYGAYAV